MNFNSPFNRSEYIEFFRNQFMPEDFDVSSESIPLTFSPQYTQQVIKIGQSRSLDLNVYEVEHTSENDPRVSLSKESFRLLAKYGQKRALVLFVSKTSDNYRLSLVTIDLKWEEGKRPTTEYSNPRRFSFFLGPDAKVHTPQEYLIRPGRVKDLDDLRQRFSIEVVNKDFYTEIAILFTKLTGGKRKIRSRSLDVKKGSLVFPSPDDTKRKEFAVRLIGRLVFCWFLKKKVSLQGIPLLPEELLCSQAVDKNQGLGGYYHSVLKPLFFEVLNTAIEERAKSFSSEPWSIIPFLNGGLFTPHDDDYYDLSDPGVSKYLNTLKVPDKWLQDLLGIFETYNFTIDENTPVDVELSIEPEMLGRIFENLLAEINPETGETARKATGSYYTPRPIVEYMVDESLKQYLLTKTDVSEEKISALLSYAEEEPDLNDAQKAEILNALDSIKVIDPACGSGAFPMGILQKILLILQKIDPDSRKWLGKILAKIDDTMIRQEFETKLKREALEYVHKLGIIRDTIYGIDIQPVAVDISKLRCFLSLIVDETIDDEIPNRGVEPLPNLEFKFVCANSLIGLDSSRLTTQKAMELKDKLKKLRADYLVSYGDEKRRLEQEFRQIQSEMAKLSIDRSEGSVETLKLADWRPFEEKPCGWFDPEWMFGVNGGFDVVIVNPPYVGEQGYKELFREVRAGSLGRYYLRKMNIFYFFFHLAINVAKEEGVIAFITTNYYVTANGARKLRQDLKNRATIEKIVNFNELKVFESASGQHNMITVLKKGKCKVGPVSICITKRIGNASSDELESIVSWQDEQTLYFAVQEKDLYDGGEKCYIRFSESSKNNGGITARRILTKMSSQGWPLLKLCNISQGLLTGVDIIAERHIRNRLISDSYKGHGVFVLDSSELNRMRLSAREKTLIYPFFKNSDIKRYWCPRQPQKYVLYLTRDLTIEEYPNILEHLQRFKEPIKARSKDRGEMQAALRLGKWWVIFGARDKRTFMGPKIICPQRSYKNTFAYNESEWFAGTDVYFITQKNVGTNLKYVLALLNSKLYYFWLYHKGKRKGEMLEILYTPLTEVPVKQLSSKDQHPFVVIIDKILSLTDNEDYLVSTSKQIKFKDYEKQIDQMVYKLYGLTDEEIDIVEGHSKPN